MMVQLEMAATPSQLPSLSVNDLQPTIWQDYIPVNLDG